MADDTETPFRFFYETREGYRECGLDYALIAVSDWKLKTVIKAMARAGLFTLEEMQSLVDSVTTVLAKDDENCALYATED